MDRQLSGYIQDTAADHSLAGCVHIGSDGIGGNTHNTGIQSLGAETAQLSNGSLVGAIVESGFHANGVCFHLCPAELSLLVGVDCCSEDIHSHIVAADLNILLGNTGKSGGGTVIEDGHRIGNNPDQWVGVGSFAALLGGGFTVCRVFAHAHTGAGSRAGGGLCHVGLGIMNVGIHAAGSLGGTGIRMGMIGIGDADGRYINDCSQGRINVAVESTVGIGKHGGDTCGNEACTECGLRDLCGGIAVGSAADSQGLTGCQNGGTADIRFVHGIVTGLDHVNGNVCQAQADAVGTAECAADFGQSAVVCAVIEDRLYIHKGITDGNAVDVSAILGCQHRDCGIGDHADAADVDDGSVGPGMGPCGAVCLDGNILCGDGAGSGDGGFAGGRGIGHGHVGIEAAQGSIGTQGTGSQFRICIGCINSLHQNILCGNCAAGSHIQNGLEQALGIGSVHHNACRNCADALVRGLRLDVGIAIAADLHIAAAGDGHGGGSCLGDAFAASVSNCHIGGCSHETCTAGIDLCVSGCIGCTLIQIGYNFKTCCLDIAAGDQRFLGAAQQSNCHGSCHGSHTHGCSINSGYRVSQCIGTDAELCGGPENTVAPKLSAVVGIVVCNGCIQIHCSAASIAGNCFGFGMDGVAVIFAACEDVHIAIGCHGNTGGVDESHIFCMHAHIAGGNTHSHAANGSAGQDRVCIGRELCIHIQIAGENHIHLIDGCNALGTVEDQQHIAVHGKAAACDGNHRAGGIGIYIVLHRNLTGGDGARSAGFLRIHGGTNVGVDLGIQDGNGHADSHGCSTGGHADDEGGSSGIHQSIHTDLGSLQNVDLLTDVGAGNASVGNDGHSTVAGAHACGNGGSYGLCGVVHNGLDADLTGNGEFCVCADGRFGAACEAGGTDTGGYANHAAANCHGNSNHIGIIAGCNDTDCRCTLDIAIQNCLDHRGENHNTGCYTDACGTAYCARDGNCKNGAACVSDVIIHQGIECIRIHGSGRCCTGRSQNLHFTCCGKLCILMHLGNDIAVEYANGNTNTDTCGSACCDGTGNQSHIHHIGCGYDDILSTVDDGACADGSSGGILGVVSRTCLTQAFSSIPVGVFAVEFSVCAGLVAIFVSCVKIVTAVVIRTAVYQFAIFIPMANGGITGLGAVGSQIGFQIHVCIVAVRHAGCRTAVASQQSLCIEMFLQGTGCILVELAADDRDHQGHAHACSGTAAHGNSYGGDLTMGICIYGHIAAAAGDLIVFTNAGSNGIACNGDNGGNTNTGGACYGNAGCNAHQLIAVVSLDGDGQTIELHMGFGDRHGIYAGDDDIRQTADTSACAAGQADAIGGDQLSGLSQNGDFASCVNVRTGQHLGCSGSGEVGNDGCAANRGAAGNGNGCHSIDQNGIGLSLNQNIAVSIDIAAELRQDMILEYQNAAACAHGSAAADAEVHGDQEQIVSRTGIDGNIAGCMDGAGATEKRGFHSLIQHQSDHRSAHAGGGRCAEGTAKIDYVCVIFRFNIHILAGFDGDGSGFVGGVCCANHGLHSIGNHQGVDDTGDGCTACGARTCDCHHYDGLVCICADDHTLTAVVTVTGLNTGIFRTSAGIGGQGRAAADSGQNRIVQDCGGNGCAAAGLTAHAEGGSDLNHSAVQICNHANRIIGGKLRTIADGSFRNAAANIHLNVARHGIAAGGCSTCHADENGLLIAQGFHQNVADIGGQNAVTAHQSTVFSAKDRYQNGGACGHLGAACSCCAQQNVDQGGVTLCPDGDVVAFQSGVAANLCNGLCIGNQNTQSTGHGGCSGGCGNGCQNVHQQFIIDGFNGHIPCIGSNGNIVADGGIGLGAGNHNGYGTACCDCALGIALNGNVHRDQHCIGIVDCTNGNTVGLNHNGSFFQTGTHSGIGLGFGNHHIDAAAYGCLGFGTAADGSCCSDAQQHGI